MKQGDTRPKLEGELTRDGVPVDLTGADLRLMVREQGATIGGRQAGGTCAVAIATAGVFRYTWAAADTATPVVLDAEVQVTYADGGVETFPPDEYFTIVVRDDLA